MPAISKVFDKIRRQSSTPTNESNGHGSINSSSNLANDSDSDVRQPRPTEKSDKRFSIKLPIGQSAGRSSSSSSRRERSLGPNGDMSKAQLRRHERKESQERRKEANEKREEEIRQRFRMESYIAKKEEPAELRARYGRLPLNQSSTWEHERRFQISELTDDLFGKEIVLRARIHTSRNLSAKLVFIVLRQQQHTIQAVLEQNESNVSEHMIKWIERLPVEAVVHVKGILRKSVQEVKAATVHTAEIKIEELHLISDVTEHLPFDVYEAEISREDEHKPEGEHRTSHISDRTRHSNRIIDLRTKTSQSIFRIQSGMCNAFRTYLDDLKFIEIHTPKLQAAATESGASVFKVEYFGRKAFLAQSPQLAKQMCISADFERVYEIGAVFRAENSNTPRHLTEYTGLDLEMAFEEHYHEVLDVIDGMFKNMFKTLYTKYADEMKIVQQSFPHKDLVWLENTPRIPFREGIQMLLDSGYEDEGGKKPQFYEDLSTRAEIRLGALVKEKYGTDFYIIDKFPASARPFYTMPDPEDPKTTNSFDIFLRGQEILSGGQRVHDAILLEEQMVKVGIDPDEMEEYLEGFRWGVPCHAGGGIGLERCLMLLLNLGNIRHASLYPRDPKSLPAKPPIVKLRHPEASTLPAVRGSKKAERKAEAEFPSLEKLIANYGDATNTSWLDERYDVWRDTITGAAMGYVVQDKYCVIFGDPLCDKSQYPKTISAFLLYVKRELKLKPIWMLASKLTEDVLADKFNYSTLSVTAEERLDPTQDPAEADKDTARKIRHASKEGVIVHDIPTEAPVPDEIQQKVNLRMQDWLANRKGKQVHISNLNPWKDMDHRRYFVAEDANKTVCALVVLAQLAPENGFQIKYSLEFPDAPSGAIEMIIQHALRSAASAGAKTVTFGSGAVDSLTPGHNLGGLRLKMLSRSYHAITSNLKLTRKTEFREKLGAENDPVYICFPKNGMGPAAIKAIMKVMGDPDDTN